MGGEITLQSAETSIASQPTAPAMLEWQYKVILAELGLLQGHASDPTCPCVLADLGERCLPKHTLTISALAAETAAMDPDRAEMLFELSDDAAHLHQDLKAAICGHGRDQDVVQWSRTWRKRLEEIYYACPAAGDLDQGAGARSARRRSVARLFGVVQRAPECNVLRPEDYDLTAWFNVPVPDYAFAVETEASGRKIDEVLRRLREGVIAIQESETFRQLLITMSKFHTYSLGNQLLITLQRPDATRVAGFRTWKELDRWVRQGEKGIAIIAPCLPPQPKPTEETGGEETEEVELRPLYFRVVYVFDVSQTGGEPLPEIAAPPLTGEANEELFARLLRLTDALRLAVSFESKPEVSPEIKGYYTGGQIWVRPEESPAQQLKTLLHEMAHYYSEDVFHLPRADAETIAESAAFAVGAHYGFDSGTYSFPYVARWAEEPKVLERNLAAIRQVFARMVEGLNSEAVIASCGLAALFPELAMARRLVVPRLEHESEAVPQIVAVGGPADELRDLTRAPVSSSPLLEEASPTPTSETHPGICIHTTSEQAL